MKAKWLLFVAFVAWVSIAGAQTKNVLLICVDDLRPELNCFGVDYIQSPNIDKLAAAGRAFNRHYVNAPSCGPSRCTLLTGRYGDAGNDALFKRASKMARDPDAVPPSMPEWFRSHGYTTVSVGKVSHHPGGLGGKDWNEAGAFEMPGAWDRYLMPVGEWQHPRGAMHGLSHGQIRQENSEFPVFEAVDGPNSIYPDGLIAEEGLKQLEALSKSDKPFFLAVGLIKPHLPFGAPKRFLDLYAGVELPPIPHPDKPKGITTWHKSAEFMKYYRWGKDPREDAGFADEVRRHYAACVSYADEHVGMLIAKLKACGVADNTVIVLWGDHGWHLGEHSIWGKHALFEESLRSPLVIYYPGIEKPGVQAGGIVETQDIFPTLCDLVDMEKPQFATGESLLPLLKNPSGSGHVAVSYWAAAKTIRTDRYRLIVHESGDVELYDHTTPASETKNIADKYPNVVSDLKARLEAKMAMSSDMN